MTRTSNDGRGADELHGAGVDEPVVDVHVGVLGRDLVDDRPPEARGRQDVGLVDAGQPAAAAAGQLEGEADDAGDLRLRVGQGVAGGARARGAGRLGAGAEVEAAGQLADDEQVDAVEELRPERRRRHEGRVDGDRAQVGEEAEAAAQGEERLLGADGGRRVVPLRAADGAQQDRVARGARGEVLVADGDAVRVDRRAAHDQVRPVDLEAEARAGGVEHALRRGDDVRADAVARDRDEAVPGARQAALRGHGRRSAGRRMAMTVPSRSAARSLLAART